MILCRDSLSHLDLHTTGTSLWLAQFSCVGDMPRSQTSRWSVESRMSMKEWQVPHELEAPDEWEVSHEWEGARHLVVVHQLVVDDDYKRLGCNAVTGLSEPPPPPPPPGGGGGGHAMMNNRQQRSAEQTRLSSPALNDSSTVPAPATCTIAVARHERARMCTHSNDLQFQISQIFSPFRRTTLAYPHAK